MGYSHILRIIPNAMVLIDKKRTGMLLCLLLLCTQAAHVMAKDKQLIGWVEKVKVYPGVLEYRAKIDTGARTSSINASNIVEFERDGETWVRFDLVSKNKAHATLELPLVREAKIKRHFGEQQHRHVVMLGICLGGIYRDAQVTLVDRSGFLYDLLLGRSFLKGEFMIDPSESFTSVPDCGDRKP